MIPRKLYNSWPKSRKGKNANCRMLNAWARNHKQPATFSLE